MVLSNVAERCVTVGGGARVGSRAFTERGLPSSSPLSRRAESVVFSRCRVAPSVAPLRSPRACFPACACAGAWIESRRCFPDHPTRLSLRLPPACASQWRDLSRSHEVGRESEFTFRPESSTARACYNTFCMERQSDFVVSHSLATLSDSESSARKKSAGISNRRGRWGVFCMTLSHDCARAKKSTLISDSSGLLAFVGPEPFYHEKWPAYRHIVG